MENKNKLNTVLLVVLIILVGVGIFLFWNNSKQKTENNNNLPQENQNDVVSNPVTNTSVTTTTTTTTATACLPTTTPWIKVLSPNGGETYTVGQTINFTLASCNVVNVISNSNIYLKRYNSSGQEISPWVPTDSKLQSNGVNLYKSNFTIPATLQIGSNTINFSDSNIKYKVYIETITQVFNMGTPDYVSDYSDNFFVINAKQTNNNQVSTNDSPTKPFFPLCGRANNISISTAPTKSLCSLGKASSVTGNFISWFWTCENSNAPYVDPHAENPYIVNCSADVPYDTSKINVVTASVLNPRTDKIGTDFFSSAVLRGYYTNDNKSPVLMWFEYGITPSLGTLTSKNNTYNSSFSNSQAIYRLQPNTTYHYQFVIQDINGSGDIHKGEVESFKTPNISN